MLDTERAIENAVLSASSILKDFDPSERYDIKQELRQELRLKVLEKGKNYKNLSKSLEFWARDWSRNYVRDLSNRRRLDAEWVSNMPAVVTRRGDVWRTRWYPPCEGAEEFAPFSCAGARKMNVKNSFYSRSIDIDEALATCVDSRKKLRVAGCISRRGKDKPWHRQQHDDPPGRTEALTSVSPCVPRTRQPMRATERRQLGETGN